MRLAVNKAIFVLNTAVRSRSAEVSELTTGGLRLLEIIITVHQRQQSWKFPAGMRNTRTVNLNGDLPPTPDGTDDFLVVKQFTDQWKHQTPVPTVIRVWLFCSASWWPSSGLTRYGSFGGFTGIRLSLADSLAISEFECSSMVEAIADECNRLDVERRSGIDGGNTRRRFHGTNRACCLGDTPLDGALCPDSNCNMCSIIKVQPEYMSSSSWTHAPLFSRAPSNWPG